MEDLYAHWRFHSGKLHYIRHIKAIGVEPPTSAMRHPGGFIRDDVNYLVGGSVEVDLLECVCGQRRPLLAGEPDEGGRLFVECYPHRPGHVCHCGGAIPQPGETGRKYIYWDDPHILHFSI